MALIYNALFTTSSIGSNRCLSLPTNAVTPFVSFPGRLDPGRRRWSSGHRRMVVQQAFQGSPATYAKEMERLSAKESLLLAFKDAGGFDALVTGKTTDVQRIDVNERITSLERLNPTPRPTTSPFLEGRWNFEWFGSGSPGLVAAKFIFERFPSNLANLSSLDAVIKDGNADITASMKLLFSIETKFILSSKLTVEGPLRMKEEYVEGIIETPKIIEETVPDQLKGALGQAVSTVQQLPVSVRDVFSSGFKIPLSGTFQRLFMISYLDEEILFDGYLKDCCHYEINASFLFLHCIFIHRFLDDEYSCRKLIANIIRDTFGIPEVLTRWDVPVSSPAEPITEYES